MAKEAIYEVNSAIEFKYRCNGDPATASPTAKVLDETGAVIDIAVEPIFDIALAQIGVTRLFKSSFIPDAVGVWSVHCQDDNGGDVVKDFAVGAVGVQSMAAKVVVIDGKIDDLDDKIDNLAADSGGAHFA